MNNNITLHFACLSRFPRLCALAVMHLLVLIPLVLPADTFGPYTYTSLTARPPSPPSTGPTQVHCPSPINSAAIPLPPLATTPSLPAILWPPLLSPAALPLSVHGFLWMCLSHLRCHSCWRHQHRRIGLLFLFFPPPLPSPIASLPSATTFQRLLFLIVVTIPVGVTSIGFSAFSWCESLVFVTIPDSVTNIGKGLQHLYLLTSIAMSENNPRYASIDGVLFLMLAQILSCPFSGSSA